MRNRQRFLQCSSLSKKSVMKDLGRWLRRKDDRSWLKISLPSKPSSAGCPLRTGGRNVVALTPPPTTTCVGQPGRGHCREFKATIKAVPGSRQLASRPRRSWVSAWRKCKGLCEQLDAKRIMPQDETLQDPLSAFDVVPGVPGSVRRTTSGCDVVRLQRAAQTVRSACVSWSYRTGLVRSGCRVNMPSKSQD